MKEKIFNPFFTTKLAGQSMRDIGFETREVLGDLHKRNSAHNCEVFGPGRGRFPEKEAADVPLLTRSRCDRIMQALGRS